MTTDIASAPATWHHGLVARWWAEFNQPEDEELAFLRSAITKAGEPVLDLGCGAGRNLVPLRSAGIDVDGCDISPDMIEACRVGLTQAGLANEGLWSQPAHLLDLTRRYRTIFMCGVFGLGSTRAQDGEALVRVYRHLEPGGVLAFDLHLPYEQYGWWEAWLPSKRKELPWNWPEWGKGRKTAANGDELEMIVRTYDLDPLEQRLTLEMKIRLYRNGEVFKEEEHRLTENLYFRNETIALLEQAGFDKVEVTSCYSDRPAGPEDTILGIVAHKPR